MALSKGRYEVSFEFADSTRGGKPKSGWFAVVADSHDQAIREAKSEAAGKNAIRWTLYFITTTAKTPIHQSGY